MRKALKQSTLTERMLALALAVSLAAFGCTTNRTPGEGEPYIGGPSVGPSSPTSNTSSASVPTTPPPMTSSYRGNEQALAAPRPQRLSPDDAAAIMAAQLPRVRVLGPVNPGSSGRPYVSEGLLTGVPQNIGAILNPGQMSINSSLNSPGGVAAITSGVGDDTQGAAIFTQNATIATPTNAAIPVTPGSLSAGPSVLSSSTVVPSITAASTATGSTTATNTTTNTTTLPAPMTSSSTIGSTTGSVSPIRTLNTSAVTNGNVRVLTTNGKVVVTNVKPQ